MSGKKYVYDEDDFYDQDDADEDYYGDYGDYDPGESQLVGKQSSKTPAQVAQSTLFLQYTQCILPSWTAVQGPNKSTNKNKAKAGTKAGQPHNQAAVSAGASALARSLFSRKSKKGGEAVLQLGCLIWLSTDCISAYF